MSRCPAFALLLSFIALAPATARAASDCPDGWFCDDGAPGAPPAPGDRPPPPNAPPDREEPPFAPPDYPPPPQDEPIIDLDQPETAPPPPRHRRQFREWGFNLHLEAALLGNKSARASNTGMGGIGFAFRYRPLPPLAFEAGVDLVTGTDYQGYSRNEGALVLNTLVFFNPHSVVQAYGLGGFSLSEASVTIAPRTHEAPFADHDEHYTYFGGQLGFGLEIRATRRLAIDTDLIGFIRGRTDSLSDTAPEFIDSNTHRATNTSGGGLLRLGATFYW